MVAMSHRYTICVVCTGNICRSPIGEVVIREALEKAGLGDEVRVTSAGTGSWHLGEGPDKRAEAVLREQGLSAGTHQAAQFLAESFDESDLILALDESHLVALHALTENADSQAKVRLLRSFDPESLESEDLDVADPYYGDKRDFEITYEQVHAAAPGIVDFVRHELARV